MPTGTIYVLLADINVSVVFHEVNNEKVRLHVHNIHRRRLFGSDHQHLYEAKSIPTFTELHTCIRFLKMRNLPWAIKPHYFALLWYLGYLGGSLDWEEPLEFHFLYLMNNHAVLK